ncbi:MAG: MaoC family dehydratase [Gammaproteobacteria bacterium]
MNSWHFDHAQIASWAQFSGDFNPIHFDIEKAMQAGSRSIIVHGMLPLLHVKQDIANRHDESDSWNQWLNIKCRLKSPLLRDARHEYMVRELGQKGKFSIRPIGKKEDLVQGTFSAEETIEPGIDTGEITLDSAMIGDRLAQFSRLFPEIDYLWIAIDSLVFSRFLESEIPFVLARENNMVRDARNQVELMNKALTIQTFHSVQISPELLRKSVRSQRDIKSIKIKLGQPVSVKNNDSELLGSHTLEIYLNGEFSMRSEIGLMLKLN